MARSPVLLEIVRARAGGHSFAYQAGPQTYLARTPGGGFREIHFDWNDSLLNGLSKLAGFRPDPLAAAEMGERLRAFLHDSPLAAHERALGEGEPGWLSLRFAAAELYALPWELLTLRPSGLSLGQLPDLLLTFSWPEARARPAPIEPRPEGGRLLFAWSEAGGRVPHAAHQAAIAASAGPWRAWSADQDVLAEASLASVSGRLRDARDAGRPYTALHVLTHGVAGPDGGALLLSGPTGAHRVDPASLRGALAPHLDTLRLVVLSACQSAAVGAPGGALGGAALALHRAGAEAVLGARLPLGVAASIRLTETFYHEIFEQSQSVEQAFLVARRAIQDAGLGASGLQLWTHADEGGDSRPFVMRPYRGLLAFEGVDQAFYFGREAERDLLLRRVRSAAEGRAPRFQVLCGATGAGKTSLLRAGLIPALRAAGWRVLRARPAGAVAAVEAARTELGPGDRLLVVVDPLQELFTAIDEPAQREAVAAALWRASQDPRLVVLAAVRVDYLGRCEEIHLSPEGPRLDTLVYDEAHRLFLAAPEPEALRRVSEGPLHRVGLEFEPGLLDLLLAEAGTEAGALPALQHTLDRLWTRREGRRLTHRGYRALGGLSGALATTADEVIDGLDAEERASARQLLVALVAVGEDGRLSGRRAAALDALLPASPEARAQTEAALERLIQARLVFVTGQAGARGVEIAHEALITRWERLRTWVEEDLDLHRRRAALERLAEEWRAHRSEPDGGAPYLLRGTRLGYAREVVGAAPTALVAALLSASVEAEALAEGARLAELAERERLAALALEAARRARDAALLATARARREADPTLALQLLREVQGAWQPLEWIREAWEVLNLPCCVGAWPRDQAPVESLAVQAVVRTGGGLRCPSPDGRWTALGGADGRIRVLDAEGAVAQTFRGHVGAILDLAWTADGRRLCSASEDQSARVWELDVGPCAVFRGAQGPVTGVRPSADGGRLATVSRDGTLRLWRMEDGRELGRRDLGAPALCLSWGPALLVGDALGRVLVLDPDGPPLALAGHRGPVVAVAWDADGIALSASEDGMVRAWRPSPSLQVPRTLPLAVRRTGSLAFCPDGDVLACGGVEDLAVILDPERPERPLLSLAGHRDGVRALDWSPDGETLATGGSDGIVRLWRRDGGQVRALSGHGAPVLALAWGAGGRLASGDLDGGVRLWAEEGQASDDLETDHGNEVRLLRFSADGRWLLSVSADRTAAITPTQGGAPWRHGVALTRSRGAVEGLAVRAAVWTGGRVILGGHGGELIALDPESRAVIPIGCLPGPVRALCASDGRVIAEIEDGQLFRVDGGALAPLTGPGPQTVQLLAQPEGGLLLGLEGSGRLWAMDLDGVLERVPLVEPARARLVALSPKGDLLAAAGLDDRLRVWPLSVRRLLALLDRASGARLSPEERRRYLGE